MDQERLYSGGEGSGLRDCDALIPEPRRQYAAGAGLCRAGDADTAKEGLLLGGAADGISA